MSPEQARRTSRERQADKRGAEMQRVELADPELPEGDPAQGLANVFALRAFAVLGFEDIGGLLERSRSAVQRDFEAARAYLLTTLDD